MIGRAATDYPWMSLERLSQSDWLVIDGDQTKLTGDGVIGHIQLLLGLYETLHLAAPLDRSFYGTLKDAVESFAPWARNASPV
jgi:hypothetical protein